MIVCWNKAPNFMFETESIGLPPLYMISLRMSLARNKYVDEYSSL